MPRIEGFLLVKRKCRPPSQLLITIYFFVFILLFLNMQINVQLMKIGNCTFLLSHLSWTDVLFEDEYFPFSFPW